MTAGPPHGPPAKAHLWHVALNVTDVACMERFYADVLGFATEWKPDADNVYMTSGKDNLALHLGEKVGETRLAHLGLVVSRAEDVDAWAEWLRRAGVVLLAEPRTHRDGARSLYLRDPEGNVIQILHHPPISPAV
jgi:catechol-2,3-dioxygenase